MYKRKLRNQNEFYSTGIRVRHLHIYQIVHATKMDSILFYCQFQRAKNNDFVQQV